MLTGFKNAVEVDFSLEENQKKLWTPFARLKVRRVRCIR